MDTRATRVPATQEFARAMLQALRRRPRRIEPKFFYDAAGIALFERICELDEYYLTRAETSILRRHAAAIAGQFGLRADIVEFGAGSPSKARILLDAAASPARYIPLDLSVAQSRDAAFALERDYPGLAVQPLEADFARTWRLPARPPGSGRRVGLFLGSTIGNLTTAQARAFLSGAAESFRGGGLLVGADLVKDPEVLHRAYNDSQGVTAAFNRNLLTRANRELGMDFNTEAFDHYAFYRPREQRIEMHLVSSRRQVVHVNEYSFEFDEGESLHTENSHKYTVDGLHALARGAGLEPGPVWCDEARRFSVHWLAAPPADGL